MNVVLIIKKTAKLTDNGNENVYHEEKYCFWKQCKLIQGRNFLFNGTQHIAQNVEVRKVDAFFIAIWIVISAVQLLTKNVNRNAVKHVWSLNGAFSFVLFFWLKKSHIVNVRLGCRYTSKVVFNDKNFLFYNIFI